MENNRFIFLDSFGERFTSFKFYSMFLKSVQEYYHSKDYDNKPPIITFSGKFFIDSKVLPLLAGIGLHLKKFHGYEIDLQLTNTPDTINTINFLDKSDFLNVVGNNINPNYPIGKKIFNFDKAYIGGYNGFIYNELNPDHKLRCYSRGESNTNEILATDYSAEIKRDYLIEYFDGRIGNDYYNIFADETTKTYKVADFTEILAELVVNGIYHSGSPVFTMAQSKFSKIFKKHITSLSVVDIGIGFYKSLQSKNENDYGFLIKNEIINELKIKNKIFLNADLSSIFEVLCFSLSRERMGLFDLLVNSFMPFNKDFQHLNYFRIHNKSCQIIISYRFKTTIVELWKIRQEIKRKYIISELNGMESLVKQGKNKIIELAELIVSEYTNNIQVSSLRIFDVEFPGVHIEVDFVESTLN